MTEAAEVTVYWRPGCGFCARLFSSLAQAGFDDFRRVDIWDDPSGAARVRELAGGNETVPTVVVGTVSMVNPSADEVLGAVAEQAPSRLPQGWEPAEQGRVAAFLDRMLGSD